MSIAVYRHISFQLEKPERKVESCAFPLAASFQSLQHSYSCDNKLHPLHYHSIAISTA